MAQKSNSASPAKHNQGEAHRLLLKMPVKSAIGGIEDGIIMEQEYHWYSAFIAMVHAKTSHNGNTRN